MRDGEGNYSPEGKSYDEYRTEILEQLGLSVIRFSNNDIDTHFEGVGYTIHQTIQERIHHIL